MFSKLVVQLFLLFMPFLLLTGCEWKREYKIIIYSSKTDADPSHQTDQIDETDENQIESRDSDRYSSVTTMDGILIKSNNGSTIDYNNGRYYVEARDAYLKIDRDDIVVDCYGRCTGTVKGRNIKVRLDPDLNNVYVTGEGSKKTYF